MLASLLAGLAVLIALQALRLASRERIVIQVMPEDQLQPAYAAKAPKALPELPQFSRPPLPRALPVAFQMSCPADIHLN